MALWYCVAKWVQDVPLGLPNSAYAGITILWNAGNYQTSDTLSHPQGLQSWATPWELQILWGDLKVWHRRLSVTVVGMKMRVGLLVCKCFRGNCASVFSVEYVTPNRTYSSTTVQGFISQKNAVFTYWWSLRTWCWEMQLFLGQVCPHTVTCLPSADFGNGGSKSGMSSADRPSTLSTTDFGRSLRPCRLFRFVERWGVACAWMNVIKTVILIYDKTLHRDINLHVRIQQAETFH